MKLRTITIGALSGYLSSERYRNTLVIPITIQRVISQVNNPRADHSDPALILAEEPDGNVLGFIGLLPDYVKSDNKQKLYWISCWWIDPEKGKMLGVPLLLAAYEAAKGFIIADSVPETVSVFRKSKLFVIPEPKQGLKLFLKPLVTDILIRKRPGLKPFVKVFRLLDILTEAFFLPVQLYRKLFIKRTTKVTTIILNAETPLDYFKKTGLFERGPEEIEWILKYPWILNNMVTDKRYYPFSSTAARFEHYLLSHQTHASEAFMHITLRNKTARLVYARVSDQFAESMVQALLCFLYQKEVAEFISFDHQINIFLKRTYVPVCVKHATSYQYVWGKPLGTLSAEEFQLGDGDAIFT